MNFAIALLASTAVLIGACGGQADAEAPLPPGVDPSAAPTPDAGGTDAPATTVNPVGACNELALLGAEQTILAVANAAPIPAGGSIRSGTYVLEAATLYTGPGGAVGPTRQKAGLTIRVVDDQVEIVSDEGAQHANATFAVSGTSLTSHQTCPKPMDTTVQFTATPQALLVFVDRHSDAGASVLVETLVRK